MVVGVVVVVGRLVRRWFRRLGRGRGRCGGLARRGLGFGRMLQKIGAVVVAAVVGFGLGEAIVVLGLRPGMSRWILYQYQCHRHDSGLGPSYRQM